MSDQKKPDSPRIIELRGIADKLNALPDMVRNFGGGLLGVIVKFIGGEVRRVDALEQRIADLEAKAK